MASGPLERHDPLSSIRRRRRKALRMGLLQQPHDRLDMQGGRQRCGPLLSLCHRVAPQYLLGQREALIEPGQDGVDGPVLRIDAL